MLLEAERAVGAKQTQAVRRLRAEEGGGAIVEFLGVSLVLLLPLVYLDELLGVGAVITATVGDLAESLLKRDLGVKDMGTLLPGHGGILDRLDSLLMTAPASYVVLTTFVS